jgi:hypothetical protein
LAREREAFDSAMLAGARRVRWPKQRLDERRAFVLISVWLQHEVKRLRVAIARHAAVAYHAHYETVNAPLVAAHEGHAGALIADGHAGKQDEKKELDFPDSIVRTVADKDLRAKRTFRRTMIWTQCSSTAP